MMDRQSIFREKNRLLIQCLCHASDFLDVNKLDWGDGDMDIEFTIGVHPISFWERLRAVWKAWNGHRYIGGVDVVLLGQEAVETLIGFLQTPAEADE